ncbi:MAG: hypothetical protein AB7R69_01820 [Candidatus Babeliales bacterium]
MNHGCSKKSMAYCSFLLSFFFVLIYVPCLFAQDVTPEDQQPQEVVEQKQESDSTPAEQPKQEQEDEKQEPPAQEPQKQELQKEDSAQQPAQTPEQAAPVVKKEGIDTVDIEEGGNWLLKRKALEDTADTIEKIVNTFGKIVEASTTYKIRRNKIDNDYDLYIATMGFNLGDLDQLLTDVSEELERERQKDVALTADERAAMATVREKQNEIKQLQAELKALADLDQEIDKVIDTVDTQIKTASNYQNQAWKYFQEIRKVLSDERAEDLYYRTVSLQKSMEDIYAYITGTLSVYFTNQIETLRGHMDSIKSKVESLQKMGIDLQKKLKQFEQEDEEQRMQQEKQEQDEAVQKAVKEAAGKRNKSNWLNRLRTIVIWPFVQVKNFVVGAFDYVASFFRSPKKQVVKPEVTQNKPDLESLPK